MNVDTKDARYLTKDLQKLVQYKDLITLEKGEAIARIGTDIVRLKTLGPLQIPEQHFKDAIIERSRKLYCKKVSFVQDTIRQKDRRWDHPFSSLSAVPSEGPEEFVYDEF